jgi:hypothetical protein
MHNVMLEQDTTSVLKIDARKGVEDTKFGVFTEE